MGGKKKAGTEVLACRKLDEEKSNSSEAGDESPVLEMATSDSSEEVLSMPLLPELFILKPSSLLHCCIMI